MELFFSDKDNDQVKIIKDPKLSTTMRLSTFNQKIAFYSGTKLFEIKTK